MSSPEAVLDALKASMQTYSTRLKDRMVGLAQVVEAVGLHLANLDEGHMTDKYDVGLSQLENYPVAGPEEAIAAESTQMYVDIDAAIAFISQNIGSNSGVNTEGPISPVGGAILFSDSPELVGGAYSHLHGFSRAYRIFQVDVLAGNYAIPLFATNVNADSTVVTPALGRGSSYRWRYRDVATTGETGVWQEATFAVASITVKAPVISYTFPINQAPIEPEFSLSDYAVTGAPDADNHISTTWTIRRVSNNAVVYSGTKTTGDLTTLTLPALLTNTQYKLQVYYTGDTYGDSGVSEVVFTTMTAYVEAPNVILDGDVENALLTPTFLIDTMSTVGQSDTLHTQEMELVQGGTVLRRWRATVEDGRLREVSIADGSTLTLESVTFPLLSFTVNGGLLPETAYTFRVRQRGQVLSYSGWGSAGFTTTVTTDSMLLATQWRLPKKGSPLLTEYSAEYLIECTKSFMVDDNIVSVGICQLADGLYYFLSFVDTATLPFGVSALSPSVTSESYYFKVDLTGSLAHGGQFSFSPAYSSVGYDYPLPFTIISADIDDTNENIYALSMCNKNALIYFITRFNIATRTVVWSKEYTITNSVTDITTQMAYQIMAPKANKGFNFIAVATSKGVHAIHTETGAIGTHYSWFYNNYYVDNELARMTAFDISTAHGETTPSVVTVSQKYRSVLFNTALNQGLPTNPIIYQQAGDRKTFPNNVIPIDVAIMDRPGLRRYGILFRIGSFYGFMIRDQLAGYSPIAYRYIRVLSTIIGAFNTGRILTDGNYFYVILSVGALFQSGDVQSNGLIIVKIDSEGNVVLGNTSSRLAGNALYIKPSYSFCNTHIVGEGAGEDYVDKVRYNATTNSVVGHPHQALHVQLKNDTIGIQGHFYGRVTWKVSTAEIGGYTTRFRDVAVGSVFLKVPISLDIGELLINPSSIPLAGEIVGLLAETEGSDTAPSSFHYPYQDGVASVVRRTITLAREGHSTGFNYLHHSPFVPLTAAAKGIYFDHIDSQDPTSLSEDLNGSSLTGSGRFSIVPPAFIVPSKDENYIYTVCRGRIIITKPGLQNPVLGEYRTDFVNGISDQTARWLLSDVTYDDEFMYMLMIHNPDDTSNAHLYVSKFIRPTSNDATITHVAIRRFNFTFSYSAEHDNKWYRPFFFNTEDTAYHRPLIVCDGNSVILFDRNTFNRTHAMWRRTTLNVDYAITSGFCTADYVYIASRRGYIARYPWDNPPPGGNNNPYIPDKASIIGDSSTGYQYVVDLKRVPYFGIAAVWVDINTSNQVSPTIQSDDTNPGIHLANKLNIQFFDTNLNTINRSVARRWIDLPSPALSNFKNYPNYMFDFCEYDLALNNPRMPPACRIVPTDTGFCVSVVGSSGLFRVDSDKYVRADVLHVVNLVKDPSYSSPMVNCYTTLEELVDIPKVGDNHYALYSSQSNMVNLKGKVLVAMNLGNKSEYFNQLEIDTTGIPVDLTLPFFKQYPSMNYYVQLRYIPTGLKALGSVANNYRQEITNPESNTVINMSHYSLTVTTLTPQGTINRTPVNYDNIGNFTPI